MNPLDRPVEFVFRLFLGGFFLLLGVSKIVDPIAFEKAIRNYQLLQDPWPAWTALCLPWLEVFAGLAVIFRIGYPGGILVIAGSLLAFMGAVISLIVRNIDASCGCYGKLGEAPVAATLAIQSALLLVALGLGWRLVRECRGGDFPAPRGGEMKS
ncbi:MAG: MauE/DoxX family redox-associated membrane protein [Verrucomicrobiota bacterium]